MRGTIGTDSAGPAGVDDRTLDMIKDELLALLVCPLGRAPLRLEGESLVCTKCGLRYAIRDGIPNMLYEEAELPPDARSIADLACAKEAEVPAS